MKKVILTGDRPTGKLHLGHYVGSLKNRFIIQEKGDYDEMYIMIADAQALTDNFNHPQKVRENVSEILLDYLAIGLDPNKVTIFIQSEVNALPELTFYYMNFVTLARLMRNPTIKSELELRNFKNNIPVGFLNYPISQTADITAFEANIVPVGDDQLPMIEQAREIVRSFNNAYEKVLVEPSALVPQNEFCARLPGLDGQSKMSKSLNNCIFLADESDVIKKKVMSMYTDPHHINISDPGQIEGNVVFMYLDVFCQNEHFVKYLPEYKNLDELKSKYQAGGVGDVTIKMFLNEILQELLAPIRAKRKSLALEGEYLHNVLKTGTINANKKALETLNKVKAAMKINYFENNDYLQELMEKYQ